MSEVHDGVRSLPDAAREALDGVAPARPDVTALAAAMARGLGAEVFKAQQLAVLDRRDRTSEIAKIAVPTLIVAGDADVITPLRLSAEMASSIPDAELHVLEGIGHLSPLEDPDAVAARIRDWLVRSDGRARRTTP
jgi:pimeloyl-ACP methyl ester carboxylesterase